jgi:hypothetical protein
MHWGNAGLLVTGYHSHIPRILCKRCQPQQKPLPMLELQPSPASTPLLQLCAAVAAIQ